MGLDAWVLPLYFRRNHSLVFLMAGGLEVGVKQLPAPGWRITEGWEVLGQGWWGVSRDVGFLSPVSFSEAEGREKAACPPLSLSCLI